MGTTSTKESPSGSKSTANIRQMEADHRAIIKELEIGEAEMRAGPITQKRGEELEELAREAEEIQQHINQYNRVAGITRDARRVDKPTLPEDQKRKRPKTIRTTPGHLFVMSDAYKGYQRSSKQGWSSQVDVKSIRGGVVVLRGEEAEQFEEKAFDPDTLSDLGTDALIEEDRDPDLVRFEEPEILNFRQVINVRPTTSDIVKFVKHTATTRAAAVQENRGDAKGYLKITADVEQATVETIAVLSKVTEQDVDDSPRFVDIINSEMRLDVRQQEEHELVWGSTLPGLFDASHGITEFDRAEVGDTLIDTIRRMRTDLRKARVMPTFVAIDPLDWETIELEKGSENRYIWGLITTLRGPQIWSLSVVETDAMTNTATNERRVLMGDGTRGASIYDRHDVRLAVGYVDDDFARNLRTLRAEERIALGVKRPFAFTYTVTEEAGS